MSRCLCTSIMDRMSPRSAWAWRETASTCLDIFGQGESVNIALGYTRANPTLAGATAPSRANDAYTCTEGRFRLKVAMRRASPRYPLKTRRASTGRPDQASDYEGHLLGLRGNG